MSEATVTTRVSWCVWRAMDLKQHDLVYSRCSSGDDVIKAEPRLCSPQAADAPSASTVLYFSQAAKRRVDDWMASPSTPAAAPPAPPSPGPPFTTVISNGYSSPAMSSGSYDPYSPNGKIGEYLYIINSFPHIVSSRFNSCDYRNCSPVPHCAGFTRITWTFNIKANVGKHSTHIVCPQLSTFPHNLARILPAKDFSARWDLPDGHGGVPRHCHSPVYHKATNYGCQRGTCWPYWESVAE